MAGGIPVIRSIKEGLIANKITKIYGILNGTTNYILSSMESSREPFSEALSRAKKLGFAENNPISDLNGNDSAAKLRILSVDGEYLFQSSIYSDFKGREITRKNTFMFN